MKNRKAFRILAFLKRLLFAESFSIIVVVLAFFSLLLSAVLFVIFGNWQFSTIMSEEKVGQFGDFVGGFIGTILAFAASLLYLLALKEQRKDVRKNQMSLQKQTEEFQNQVSELKQSRQAFQKQLEMMRIQQFESFFYSYFNVYLNIKAGITNKTPQGETVLNSFLSKMSDRLKDRTLCNKNEYDAYLFASKIYCQEIISSRFSLTHYFRTFYRLMTIAVSAPVESISEKMKYVKIVRSQLTEDELLVLYYNSHSRYAGESQRLLYEFNVLKHLSPLHKYEIANRFVSKDKQFLMQVESFYDYISPIIKNFVNLVCDNVEERYEEHFFDSLDISISLEYDEEICVSIVNTGTYKSFVEFGQVFRYLLFDLIFNAQMIGVDASIKVERGFYPHTNYKQIQYKIDSSKIRKIIIDKDDE